MERASSLPARRPAKRGHDSVRGSTTERGNPLHDEKRKVRESRPLKNESSDACIGGGAVRSSDEGSVIDLERRDCQTALERKEATGDRMTSEARAKPFEIPKREVSTAWKRVKKQAGAGGVDGVSIADFEAKLSQNLYKLWNRMSSGSYIPKAVKRVEIPKKDGGKRSLGIPVIADRVAQEVVRARLERILEPMFHDDSYGYRPKKSAIDAVRAARQRNWKFDWVLDVDLRKFFDTIDHALMMRAVKKHAPEKWMVLYIERWLKAPVQNPNGEEIPNERGTPQGGVISPLLANLYLHYAFDKWLTREYPQLCFERYADDIVIHCRSREESEEVRVKLGERLASCGLALHEDKTQVVYCQRDRRPGSYPTVRYTFLGYTFQPRMSIDRKGVVGTNFLPAASRAAKKELTHKLKKLGPRRLSTAELHELAIIWNPVLRGWFEYYRHFYRSALNAVVTQLDRRLLHWARKRHRWTMRRAIRWLNRQRHQTPHLFMHWRFISNGV